MFPTFWVLLLPAPVTDPGWPCGIEGAHWEEEALLLSLGVLGARLAAHRREVGPKLCWVDATRAFASEFINDRLWISCMRERERNQTWRTLFLLAVIVYWPFPTLDRSNWWRWTLLSSLALKPWSPRYRPYQSVCYRCSSNCVQGETRQDKGPGTISKKRLMVKILT